MISTATRAPMRSPMGFSTQSDHGMVTAELALGILTTVLLLMIMCWAVALAVLELRCIDTAAEVARQAARDDPAAVVQAQRDAPAGAVIGVHRVGDRVLVDVTLEARPGRLRLPAVHLTATAETLVEGP